MNQDQAILLQAIRALKVDVPVMSYTLRQGEIELRLYGGGVRVWRYAPHKGSPAPVKPVRRQPPLEPKAR